MIKKAIHSRHFPLFVSTILGLLFLLISYDYGMFWDNVLFASKMGNHLFENGLFHCTIPDDLILAILLFSHFYSQSFGKSWVIPYGQVMC